MISKIRHDDFDAYLSERAVTDGPVYSFTLGGHLYIVTEVNIDGWAAFADLGARLPDMNIAGMIQTLRDMIASQLTDEDRERWTSQRVPLDVLQGICERLAEAVAGRPLSRPSTFGQPSEATGQGSRGNSSEAGTLPPPLPVSPSGD